MSAKQLTVRERLVLLLMDEEGVETEEELQALFPLDELDEAEIFPSLEAEFGILLNITVIPPQTLDELLELLEKALAVAKAA